MIDGHINTTHVAHEQTLRARHGHPNYIAELDGAGKFYPPITTSVDGIPATPWGINLSPAQRVWERQRDETIAMLADRYGIRAHRDPRGIVISRRSWRRLQDLLGAEKSIERLDLAPQALGIALIVGSWWTILAARIDEWTTR